MSLLKKYRKTQNCTLTLFTYGTDNKRLQVCRTSGIFFFFLQKSNNKVFFNSSIAENANLSQLHIPISGQLPNIQILQNDRWYFFYKKITKVTDVNTHKNVTNNLQKLPLVRRSNCSCKVLEALYVRKTLAVRPSIRSFKYLFNI